MQKKDFFTNGMFFSKTLIHFNNILPTNTLFLPSEYQGTFAFALVRKNGDLEGENYIDIASSRFTEV
jgi:hypothetical protein